MSSSERKAHALKRDLSDIKNSMSEINNLAAMGRTPGVGDIKLSNTTTMNQLTEKFVNRKIYLFFTRYNEKNHFSCRIRSSIENLVDGPDNEPLVTFPDDTPSEELHLDLTTNRPGDMVMSNGHQLKTIGDTVKFEETRTVSASRNQIITDGYSSESVSFNLNISLKL